MIYRNNGNSERCMAVLVTSLIFIFVFFFAAQGRASESAAAMALASSDVRSHNAVSWQQILTQNAGSLSLSWEWEVVSKDGPVERKRDAERMFHVQQVLYAKSKKRPGNQGAALQIFSIWNADSEGKILPLPSDILEKTSGDLAAGLIGARYGSVTTLTQEVVGTDLEDLFVTTYGVGGPRAEENANGFKENFRYKCVSLFCGEKLVLVLVKYFPSDEKFWRKELETLLDTWVATLTLTPRPLAEISRAAVSLPVLPIAAAAPVPALSADISAPAVSQGTLPLAAKSSGDMAAQPVTTQPKKTAVVPRPQKPISSLVFYTGFALAATVIFFACAGKIFYWRRKRQKDPVSADSVTNDLLLRREIEQDTAETEPMAVTNEPASDDDIDDDIEENIEENPNIEENQDEENRNEENRNEENYDQENYDQDHDIEDDHSIGENDKGGNIPCLEKSRDKELNFDWERTEELLIPLVGDPRDFQTRDPLSEKLGFDRVYSLLNEALVSIDTAQIATTPVISDKRALQPALPNLADAVAVLDSLQEMFGESFLLETLKEEVLKALELKEGTPILHTKDMAPECFVLKLSCSTLLNMLQTGRYHIGKGILSNEGQELVNLFGRINDLRTREAYTSREEAEKDAAFMQFCVRELG
ncbi:MAG: hypothetical protein LBP21_11630 [Synergistaceae bacterium]|nr:hypothetical protein [Synergistaceae bacterium]